MSVQREAAPTPLQLPGFKAAGSAEVSVDGLYRYTLTRVWSAGTRSVVMIMLNPSIADAELDDPTIRRCVRFAQREDAHHLTVVNLYGYRATDPNELWTVDDPVGPDNDAAIANALMTATGPIIAAWGAHARADRAQQVVALAGDVGARLQAFGTTKHGQPRHPLYLRGDSPLASWTPTVLGREESRLDD